MLPASQSAQHYFYDVLGASYTLPVGPYTLNEVPVVMYLLTQPYFLSYHVLAACAMRRFDLASRSSLVYWSVISLAAYGTAFAETWSISAYPHYVCVALHSE